MFNKRQAGLTLIEMMIAMVLGLFVTAVIITVFSTNVRSSTENIKMIRLNQELRGVMTMMVDEIKRAGYSADPTNSDFMDDFNVFPTAPPHTCLRYSYDENRDGIRDANERFGFKLEDDTVKWTTSGGDPNTAPICGVGVWTELTDPNLAFITTLDSAPASDFKIIGSANSVGGGVSGITALTTTTGISVYDVTITLTGITDLPHSSPANDPRRTIIETIRIRNDDPKD